MNKTLILNAWEHVNNDTRIKRFYFLPWLLSVIFLMVILLYQVIYTYVILLHKEDQALKAILSIFEKWYFTEIVIIGIVFTIIYIIIIPICEWGLIWYISQKNSQETRVSISDSLSQGIYRFLPMFEYGNLFSEFKFISVINIYLFCLRFAGIEYIRLVNYIFLFLLVVSTIINILFSYTRYEIVLGNKWAFSALNESAKIAIINLPATIKTHFFLFLINIRIIINFIVFLSFPILIASAITYLSTIYIWITVIFLSIVFLILILILWYVGWVFEAFKLTVWYGVYVLGKQKLKLTNTDDDDDDD